MVYRWIAVLVVAVAVAVGCTGLTLTILVVASSSDPVNAWLGIGIADFVVPVLFLVLVAGGAMWLAVTAWGHIRSSGRP